MIDNLSRFFFAIISRMVVNRSPFPRAAHAAFPSPSCSGKRPKVERWRGVNGLANYGL